MFQPRLAAAVAASAAPVFRASGLDIVTDARSRTKGLTSILGQPGSASPATQSPSHTAQRTPAGTASRSCKYDSCKHDSRRDGEPQMHPNNSALFFGNILVAMLESISNHVVGRQGAKKLHVAFC